MKPDTSHPSRLGATGLLLLVAACLLAAGPVVAHTLTAPAAVQADAVGDYATTAIFTAGPGSAWLSAANVHGTENAGANEVMIDFFCTTEYPEGETVVFELRGRLVNPGQAAAIAIQVFDCDGLEYWREVEVLTAAPDLPLLAVAGADLGDWLFQGTAASLVELVVGVDAPLDFSWLGDAGHYAGTIAGYRFGWDVLDPEDDNDPGWMTGFQPDLLVAPTRSFGQGVHNLYIEVRDVLGAETRAGFRLQVQATVTVETGTWGGIKSMFR